jgi:phosphatidylglycerophosphate synthase
MMPFLARFRQHYEQLTLPLGRFCLRLGLSADMLTYLSLALSVLAAVLIARGALLWGVAAILGMGLADVLDGSTARAAGTASAYGTVLDHVTDRYAEFFVLGGVMVNGLVEPAWVLFALFGMVMASYVRARAESTGKVASCNVGFAGRQEKLGLLIIGLIVQAFFPGSAVLAWTVIAIGVVSHITAVQRLHYTRQILVNAANPPDMQQGSRVV